ncbi:hypothetical protein Tco_1517701 [Tanacetum coccineum]
MLREDGTGLLNYADRFIQRYSCRWYVANGMLRQDSMFATTRRRDIFSLFKDNHFKTTEKSNAGGLNKRVNEKSLSSSTKLLEEVKDQKMEELEEDDTKALRGIGEGATGGAETDHARANNRICEVSVLSTTREGKQTWWCRAESDPLTRADAEGLSDFGFDYILQVPQFWPKFINNNNDYTRGCDYTSVAGSVFRGWKMKRIRLRRPPSWEVHYCESYFWCAVLINKTKLDAENK